MRSLKLIWILAEKDLRLEYRSRQAFLTTFFFALLILVVFQFAFDPGSTALREAAPGVLWTALLFPGVIQLNRSFQLEKEEGTLHGILLSPVERSLLFSGKFLANWVFLVAIDLLIVVAFVIFFNFSFEAKLAWILLLILLASAGFSAVGTLFAAMVSGIRTREVLLPILLFPIIVPTILAAVNGTQEVLLRHQPQFLVRWIQLLSAFDIIFLAVAFIVFDYVLDE
ncbi:MAG: heme exporter protein CcmB [Acidobacteria bacterium]|nr:heme exporter protein CcmB [Acidobacteriota bacterium]